MTPRERAEALGWKLDPGGWWRSSGAAWVLVTRGRWAGGVRFSTRERALAHALLLRDVVLS